MQIFYDEAVLYNQTQATPGKPRQTPVSIGGFSGPDFS
jgi:hypothetical protein